jgi:ParB family chromosome partitioning protein
MAKPRKGGLGKGLEALFMDNQTDADTPITLQIEEIEPNRDQPRRNFDPDKLEELSASIAEHGVITPLLVRPLMGGRYQIVAGERRWRAARMAGLTELPVVVRQLTDSQCMQLALVENLQRDDLNPVEEARGYQNLLEEHNLTQEEIARFVGRSRPAVANALRLLSLPEPVLAHLEQGRLSAGHARALVTLPDEQAAESALQIIKQGLSVRQTEALVKRLTGQPGKRSRGPSFGRSFLKEVELSLTESMGRKVRVSPKGAGGTLSLTFTSEEDLRNLMRQLCRMDGDPIALPPQSLKKGE